MFNEGDIEENVSVGEMVEVVVSWKAYLKKMPCSISRRMIKQDELQGNVRCTFAWIHHLNDRDTNATVEDHELEVEDNEAANMS
ncbi:hypothetical protein HPP92_027036 [Vanilla planifolia]|uniref:Uncharacterized protein n=1 Tax=Vanilla planifolia TaxID=51239 RepID=A0A835PDU7_VANPL|nr:hypothetical protein HPP92_027036 [Vanilla planifolia]